VKRLTVAGAVVAAALCLGVLPAARASAPSFFSGCAGPSDRPALVVGRVGCQELPSPALGGTTAFSYYVPPACSPATGRRCPVLYLLHGWGGDYTSELGTADHPSAWVAGLSSGPTMDPHTVTDPWDYSDPSKWTPRAGLGLILVAPDGRTVPGGYGPGPGIEGFWDDWNPRYAVGGDAPRYRTPPPRFATDVVGELIPYVDRHFPTGSGRQWRALVGTSLGGYGSYEIGLLHPDLFSSLGSVSGILNILLAPAAQPVGGAPVGVQPPVPLGYHRVPGPIAAVPGQVGQQDAENINAATLALGDPVADQDYYRGNTPLDLAINAAAFGGGRQVTVLRGFSNDAVPRRPADFSSPGGYLVAQGFESLVLDANVEFQAALAQLGIHDHYELHPGIHNDAYWNPWVRGQLEAQYASLRHWDGGGSPPGAPDTFSYRSISRSFAVWGWAFNVERPNTEFLEIDRARCSGLTLRGTGRVVFTVPTSCATGVHGSRTVTVDLGPSMPTDAPAGAGATPVYGRTVTVVLRPLR